MATAAATWLSAQDAVLLAARTHGLQAIDGPYLGLEPDARFMASVHHVRDLGFDGKWAIHPSQLEALNVAFTPGVEEIERARAVLAALAQARREGGQGAVALDGEMIDEAVRVGALRILARAGADPAA
jgi:citrate lyase subunit beta / citryl-CoA lyase